MIIPIKPWLERADGQPVTIGGYRSRAASLGEVALVSDPEGDEIRRSREDVSKNRQFDDITRMEFYHESIMGREIVEQMAPTSGKQFLDATLGGGGHSELLLAHGAHVIGLDQDASALEHASERLEKYGDRFLSLRGNFAKMDEHLASIGVDSVDGVLLDLGVSSRQFDDGERGFSFREDAPLDMRMDQGADLSARDVVNGWSVEDLVRIFREYGEEKRAGRVAKRIEEQRAIAPIETTGRLAEVVASVVPKVGRKHPATRVFQAIRIAVNRELEVLEEGLEKVVDLLAPGGVLAVISFHSLEDRIVKRFLRARSEKWLDRPEWPEPRPNPDYSFDLPFRKPVTPTEEEIAKNARARSSKLRVAVKR